MRNLFFASLMMLSFSLGAQAQDAKKAPKNLELNTETMNKLGLNEEQQNKITKIIKDRNDDILAVKKDKNLSQDEKNAKVKALIQLRSAQQDSVFTREQRKQLLQLKREFKAKQEASN